MASIHNSINLTDRMSPVLRIIVKALDSTLKAMDNLDKASNKGVNSAAFRRAARDVNAASAEVESLVGKLNKTPPILGKIQSGFDKISKSASKMKNSWAVVTTGINSALSVLDRLADKISSVMDSVDKSRSAIARLNLYNTSGISGEKYYNEIYKTALATRSDLEDMADMVNKLLISGVYQGKGNVMASTKMAGLLNKVLIAGGGTNEENSRAIRQLMQGLSSGVLQGDELRSIREQTPYLMDILAQGLAKVDKKFEGIGIGDLKALGAQGELTSRTVIKAFTAMEGTINDAFRKMPKTFGQGMTSLKTIWKNFLWQLSLVDGPLAKINNLVWELVDFLNSEDGTKFFDGLAKAIRIAVDVLIWLIDVGKKVVSFFQKNTPILESLFIALGVAAVAAGVAALAAWVAAAWPILLIVAVVGLVAHAFISAGSTVGDVIGGILGVILFTVNFIEGFIMTAIAVVGYALITLGTIAVADVQIFVKAVRWLIVIIWSGLRIIWGVLKSVVMGAWGVIQWLVSGIAKRFNSLAQLILNILRKVASAIDSIFGSHLADTVDGWMNGLNQKIADLLKHLNYKGTFEDIELDWEMRFADIKAQLYEEGPYEHWKDVDPDKTIREGLKLREDLWDWADDNTWDPEEGWKRGQDIGASINKAIEDLKGLDIPDEKELKRLLKDMMPGSEGVPIAGGVPITGGNLDSVGSIKSDVNINDEDIKLLRDMAARDYLLNLQQITPVAHINFGDIRETADVRKIMDVIEDMVEEQMATALVAN